MLDIEDVDFPSWLKNQKSDENANHKKNRNFCSSLKSDIKTKYKNYLSDFADGFHVQCFTTVVFIYLTVLSNVVIFGSLTGSVTETSTINCTKSTVFSGTSSDPNCLKLCESA